MVDDLVYVEGGTKCNTTLAPGSHVYTFCFTVPNLAPASIEGSDGEVRYSMSIIVKSKV